MKVWMEKVGLHTGLHAGTVGLAITRRWWGGRCWPAPEKDARGHGASLGEENGAPRGGLEEPWERRHEKLDRISPRIP